MAIAMTPKWFRVFRREWQHRQQRQRVARYFGCTWQSPWGRQRSRIRSISPTGCYIEDRLSVPNEGEEIPELSFDLPTGPINLQGTVIEAMRGVGFAVRFTAIDAATSERLTAFVQGVQGYETT